jgi:hypothetical protein
MGGMLSPLGISFAKQVAASRWVELLLFFAVCVVWCVFAGGIDGGSEQSIEKSRTHAPQLETLGQRKSIHRTELTIYTGSFTAPSTPW